MIIESTGELLQLTTDTMFFLTKNRETHRTQDYVFCKAGIIMMLLYVEKDNIYRCNDIFWVLHNNKIQGLMRSYFCESAKSVQSF